MAPRDEPARGEQREGGRERDTADGLVILGVILLAAGAAAICWAAFGPLVAAGAGAVVTGLACAVYGIVLGAEQERQDRAAKARGETPDVPGRER